MTTFIGGISALQFLVSASTPQRRVHGSSKIAIPQPTQSAPQQCTPVDLEQIRDLGFPDGIYTDSLHINVPDHKSRCHSDLVTTHVWPAPVKGSYLRIDDEYRVLTPEACFAQMAGELPLTQLTELAMMMCGTYAPAPDKLPTRYDVEPLTTPRKLAAYIARLKGKRGLDNARIAARLAAAGSGSPMESKIAAALALSTRQGGMGAPALLNPEIELTDEARGLGYRDIRRPDFLWPRYKLAMDYDSREYHDEKEAAEADMTRRNELSAMGLNSIVARKRHFKNQLEFEALMGQLFAAMPKSMESTVRELPEKRARLFDELFGSKRWRPMDVR